MSFKKTGSTRKKPTAKKSTGDEDESMSVEENDGADQEDSSDLSSSEKQEEQKDQPSPVPLVVGPQTDLHKNKRSDFENSQNSQNSPASGGNGGWPAQDSAAAERALITLLGEQTMAVSLIQSMTYEEFVALRAVSRRTRAVVDSYLPAESEGLSTRARIAHLFIRFQGIGKYASPFHVLYLARQFPIPLHSELWQAFGIAVGMPGAGPGEILAQLAARQGWLSDADLRAGIAGLTEDGERQAILLNDFDLAATEVNPLFNLDTDMLSFAMPDESTRGLSAAKAEQIKSNVHERLAAKMSTIREEIIHDVGGKKGWSAKYRRRIAVNENMAVQRALDRLAWVLAHLNDARECVAVAHTEGELHTWANNPDDRMGKDLELLVKAGKVDDEAGMDDLNETFDELWALLKSSSLDERTGEGGDLHMAERRLLKAIRFLADLQQKWTELKIRAHEETYNLGNEDRKVHTEMQAATQLLQNRDRARAEADRKTLHLLETIVIAIGISKLCCLKCYLGILAMRGEGIRFGITGTHLTTYAWPVSPALVAPALLRAILGVPDEPTDKQDVALAAAIDNDLQRRAVIKAIESFDHSGGMGETGYVSSEDEEGLEFRYAPRSESGSGSGSGSGSDSESSEAPRGDKQKRTLDEAGEGEYSEEDGPPAQKRSRTSAWQEWQDVQNEQEESDEESSDDYNPQED
ncbi:hypothetical protein [Streptosporangium sp. NPDC002524]|uniref:hypothetical protein n=1 Tax=Streptosporangium sp. NPDC002524 TaxID=3154537 RepID=UPI00332A9205